MKENGNTRMSGTEDCISILSSIVWKATPISVMGLPLFICGGTVFAFYIV
jgi:hypothetical protein